MRYVYTLFIHPFISNCPYLWSQPYMHLTLNYCSSFVNEVSLEINFHSSPFLFFLARDIKKMSLLRCISCRDVYNNTHARRSWSINSLVLLTKCSATDFCRHININSYCCLFFIRNTFVCRLYLLCMLLLLFMSQ